MCVYALSSKLETLQARKSTFPFQRNKNKKKNENNKIKNSGMYSRMMKDEKPEKDEG